ncbi:MAG: hypothetical protein ACR2IF_09450 [Terriglobales bacterium]
MRSRQLVPIAVLILVTITASADTKIKTRHTVMGHSTEGTVYIKGARERTEMNMGMGPTMVTVTQCDQKRIITINPASNTCMVVPLSGDVGEAASAAPAASSAGTTKGGTIVFNINTLDTGERQKMLGLDARHVKMTMSAESSPDACSKTNMRMESDGWYANIAPGLSCSMGGGMGSPSRGGRAGCQDTVRFKRTGSAYPGYPLKQTMTMNAEGHTVTMQTEVVELTSSTLDASLFDMPAGCRVVTNYADLMKGGMGGMMAGRPTPPPVEAPAPPKAEPPAAAPVAPPAPTLAAKGAGVIRVGVVKINDASGEYLPISNLRMYLMSEVTRRQMEAVPLDSGDQSSVAAEATDKQCDYILYTDTTQVKAPDSGGIVVPAALKGIALDKSKYQALVAMTLYRAGKPQPELKQVPLAAAADQMGVNAVMAGFEMEAQKVADQVKKDHEPAKPAAKPGPARRPAPKKKPG